jgi:hypothetical protein
VKAGAILPAAKRKKPAPRSWRARILESAPQFMSRIHVKIYVQEKRKNG